MGMVIRIEKRMGLIFVDYHHRLKHCENKASNESNQAESNPPMKESKENVFLFFFFEFKPRKAE